MLGGLVFKEQEVLCDKIQKEPRGHMAGSRGGGFWAGAVPSGDRVWGGHGVPEFSSGLVWGEGTRGLPLSWVTLEMPATLLAKINFSLFL